MITVLWIKKHKHILTGNLNIIKNQQLRKLISKGPKYRETESISWKIQNKKLKLHLLNRLMNFLNPKK